MKNQTVTEMAYAFKRKYNHTVGWRIRKNARVIENHLNEGEFPLYVFVAQKNHGVFDFFQTAVIALTNKRILIGRDRVVIGYFLDGVTPDMFNDLRIASGLLWGRVIIDTIKERICLSNIDKRALDEIETHITSYMMTEKKKYGLRPSQEESIESE